MASKREGIVDAVIAALGVASVGGTTKPSGLTVHRMRTRPLQTDALPALVVYLAAETVAYDASVKAERRLRFWAEARVKHPGADPDSTLDPLLVWAVKALQTDITLGGKTIDITEIRTAWDLAEQADTLAAAAVEFEAVYHTAHNDPETV